MKPTEANLLRFLKKSSQLVIPIDQRHYSWAEAQCRQLWTLLRAGRLETVSLDRSQDNLQQEKEAA